MVDFPSFPSFNQSYTYQGKTWRFNGIGWVLVAGGVPAASVDAPGIVQLVDSAGSTSTTLAPTANALKQVSDNLTSSIGLKAPLDSPALTGVPTSSSPPLGDSSTRIATTAFTRTTLTGALFWGQNLDANLEIDGILYNCPQVEANDHVTIRSNVAGRNIYLEPGPTGRVFMREYGAAAGLVLDFSGVGTYRTITFPDANVTLTGGTMVPTNGSGAFGTWGINITGSAASADTAGYATSAGSATSADTAGYATSAGSANTAGSASTATTASSASYATTAGSAGTATTLSAAAWGDRTLGSVGSYFIGAKTSAGTAGAGATLPGSEIDYAYGGADGLWKDTTSASPGGTWRVMGGQAALGQFCLFYRVS